MSGQEHLFCGFFVQVKQTFGSCSLTISYVSAVLDRQGVSVAATVDLRTKNTESFLPQLLQGFWSRLKEKNPKIVVMSPTATSKNSKQEEVIRQQFRLCLAAAEYQIRGGQHFLILGPETCKSWWLKKVQKLQKISLPMDSSAWKNTQMDLS